MVFGLSSGATYVCILHHRFILIIRVITRSYDFLDQIFVIWDVQIARKDKQFKHRATYFDRLCEFEQILIRLNESISLKIYSNDQVLGNFLKSSCIQFGFQTFEHLVYLNNSTCRMLEEKY